MADTNFFEVMGNTDMEKIHSQFLVWFFNSSQDDEVKTMLLRELFSQTETPIKGNLSGFQAYSEVEQIDVVIITNEAVFLIENKLKSVEHLAGVKRQKNKEKVPQTIEYDKIFKELQNKEPNRFKRDTVYKGYLSLIGEEPKSNKWEKITYTDLSLAFEKIIATYSIVNEFVTEYAQAIKNLQEHYSDFLRDTQASEYRCVFEKKQKKYQRESNSNELQNYIIRNSFQTIYQRGFICELISKLSSLCKNDNVILNNYRLTDKDEESFPHFKTKPYHYHFGEYNGNALVHIDVTYFRYRGKKGKVYSLGFQYQGGSCKIICERPGNMYKESKKDDILFMEKVFSQKDVLFDRYKKYNRPRSKAHISISHRSLALPPQNKFDSFAKDFFDEFKEALGIIKKLEQKVKEKYKDAVEFL